MSSAQSDKCSLSHTHTHSCEPTRTVQGMAAPITCEAPVTLSLLLPSPVQPLSQFPDSSQLHAYSLLSRGERGSPWKHPES